MRMAGAELKQREDRHGEKEREELLGGSKQ